MSRYEKFKSWGIFVLSSIFLTLWFQLVFYFLTGTPVTVSTIIGSWGAVNLIVVLVTTVFGVFLNKFINQLTEVLTKEIYE